MKQIIEKYRDGNLKFKYYKNDRGEPHGLIIRYYANGENIWYKSNWVNGKQYGLDVDYDTTGVIDKQIYHL